MVCDIAGPDFRVALGDAHGRVAEVQRKKTLAYASGATPEQILDGVVRELAAYARGPGRDLAPTAPVVCSVPGPVASRRRLLAAPPLLGPCERPPDLQALLAAELKRPVELINDVSAAAWFLSTQIPDDRFFVVHLSAGIGSKLFDRAHPRGVLDDLAFAGEISHVVVDSSPDALPCECGGRGHLGAIASGRGFVHLAQSLAKEKPDSFGSSLVARRFGATLESLDNELHLVPAILAGDPWAVGVLARAVHILAPPLQAIAVATGLQRIVLMGGFAQSLGPLVVKLLTAELSQMSRAAFAPPSDRLVLIREADEQTCLLGAAAYALRLGAAA